MIDLSSLLPGAIARFVTPEILPSQLEEQYNNNQQFRQEMQEAERRYRQNCQHALYSNLDAVPDRLFAHVGGDEYGHSVLLYSAALVTTELPQQKLYLYLIKRFESLLMANQAIKDKKYSLIFNNAGCTGSANYFNFKLVFRMLPMPHFLNLKHFIVFMGNMSIKANEWLARGTVNNYLRSRIVTVNDVRDFVQYGIEPSPELISELREGTLSSMPEQLMEEPNDNELKLKRFNYTAQGKYHKKESELDIEKIFYSKSPEYKPKLSELELSPIKVPLVLELLVHQLSTHEEFLAVEGIFRKCPSIDDERKALIHLYEKDYDYIEEMTDPHLLCTLIKKILNNLAQPLFSYELYQVILGHNINQEQHWFFKCILRKMAEVNYNTLLFLLKFFDEKVIPLQKINKMTANNVAIVMAPCIMKAKHPSMMDIQYAGVLITFLHQLLLHFHEVFGDKDKQESVFQTAIRQEQKEIEKRLSTHLQNPVKQLPAEHVGANPRFSVQIPQPHEFNSPENFTLGFRQQTAPPEGLPFLDEPEPAQQTPASKKDSA